MTRTSFSAAPSTSAWPRLLWDGTDPLRPQPLEDRDIFELLGFD
jgi:hypothetical protein